MHGTREIIRLGSNDIFSPEELTAKAFRRAEWKLRIAQASASGSTMREVLGLFAILADGAVFLLDKDRKISYFSGSSHTSQKAPRTRSPGRRLFDWYNKKAASRLLLYIF